MGSRGNWRTNQPRCIREYGSLGARNNPLPSGTARGEGFAGWMAFPVFLVIVSYIKPLPRPPPPRSHSHDPTRKERDFVPSQNQASSAARTDCPGAWLCLACRSPLPGAAARERKSRGSWWTGRGEEVVANTRFRITKLGMPGIYRRVQGIIWTTCSWCHDGRRAVSDHHGTFLPLLRQNLTGRQNFELPTQ